MFTKLESRSQQSLSEKFEVLTSQMRQGGGYLYSPEGMLIPVVDACAYPVMGLLERALEGTLRPLGRARKLVARLKANFDRRWVATKIVSGSPRVWMYILCVKGSSWRRQYESLVDSLQKARPDVGIILIEEVPRGASPALNQVGSLAHVTPKKVWRFVRRSPSSSLNGVDSSFSSQLEFLTNIQGVILKRWLDFLSGAFAKWPPDLVVLNNDLESSRRTATIFAQALGVPVVNIQHGLINDAPQYRLGIADLHLLWGNAFVDLLGGLGHDTKRLLAVGSAHYEHTQPQERPADGEKTLLLYAAQPASFEIPESTCRRLIDDHIQLAKRQPGIDVTIRLHPRESDSVRRYVRRQADRTENLHECVSPDVTSAIAKCHVVSTVFSTVSLDAAVARRPTVLLDYAGLAHRFPFDRTPPWFSAESMDAYTTTIDHARRWLFSRESAKGFAAFDRHYLVRRGSDSRIVTQLSKLMGA